MSDLQSMQCPGCGAAITSGRENCEYCGSKIQWPKEEVKTTQVVERPTVIHHYVEQPAAPTKRTSGAAVAALILALLGIAPLALIFGIVGLRATSNPEDNITGRGLAVAGVIISLIQIFFWIIWIIIAISASCAYRY